MLQMILSKIVFVPDENGELSAAPDTTLLPLETELPNGGDYGLAFLKMFIMLLIFVVLFGVTIWFLRRLIRQRLERGTGEQSITILEKKMLSQKTMLYVIEVEGEKILLAESQLEIRELRKNSPHLENPLE